MSRTRPGVHAQSRMLPTVFLQHATVPAVGRIQAVLLATSVMVSSSFARANTLASRTVDIDGDGIAESVTVGLDGTVWVAALGKRKRLGKLTTTAWRIKAARIEAQRVGQHDIVLVRAAFLDEAGRGGTFADSVEVAAFDWQAHHAQRLFAKIVGPKPSDPDLESHIEIGPGGILRYQTRPGVTRCDEIASRLNMHKFDFVSKRFRAVSSRPHIPAQTPVLRATRWAKLPEGLKNRTPARVFRFVAASTDTDGARPTALNDSDPKTVWSESRGGYGRGDFFTARAKTQAARIVALRFIPGDARHQKHFLRANRLRRLLLVTDRPESQLVIQLATDPANVVREHQTPYWVVFKKPLPAKCVSLVIDEVFFGRDRDPPRQGRTAISEIAILTEFDRGSEKSLATLAVEIAGGGRNAANAEHLLGQFPRAAGVAALLAALPTIQEKRAQKRRVLLLLARIGDRAAAAELARALRATTSDDDFARYSRGLRKMGAGATAALAKLLAQTTASQRARLEAAVLLGTTQDPNAVAALLAVCGQGDRILRNQIIRSVAGHTAMPLVTERLGDDQNLACATDMWRVVSLVAAREPSGVEHNLLIDQLARRMAHKENSYELRYRLLQAAAAMFQQPAANNILTHFMATPDTEPALRRVVIDALPRGGGPLNLLRLALHDPDPGVRMRATRRLASMDQVIDDKAIIELLHKDAWPSVRRAAASALGNRCRRDTAANALQKATLTDPRTGVQRAALLSLVQCNSPRLGKTLLVVIADPRHDRGLREKAATLLGKREHKKLAKDALRLFKAERQRAFRSGDAVRVAAALAKSLGRLGDPAAQKSLLDAAQDATFPFIQAGAISALGQLCRPGTHKFLLQFAYVPHRLIGHAAQRSLRRCRQ